MNTLRAAGAEIEVKALAELGRLAGTIETLAKSACPVSVEAHGDREPGTLRESIYSAPGVDVLGPHWEVGTHDLVGVFVEYGTRGHWIEATNAKVLTDGTNFFGKRVWHPEQPPNPFMRNAILEAAATWSPAIGA